MYFQKMAIAGMLGIDNNQQRVEIERRKETPEENPERSYAVEFGKEAFDEGAMDPVLEEPKTVEQKSVICAFLRKWFKRD